MPKPNLRARSYSSPAALCTAAGGTVDATANAEAAANGSARPVPGEKWTECLFGSQEQGNQADWFLMWFGSPGSEQQEAPVIASASAESGSFQYALYGPGWAYTSDTPDSVQSLQSAIGGSLVTYYNGQEQGFQ